MPKQIAKTKTRISILRILLCSVLLTALVAGCMYLYYTAFDFYRDRLLDDESKTLAWFTEQIGFSLPFVIICVFQLAVYHKHDPHDGSVRREMFWEIALVAVLVYAVLLPYLASISEALYINALASGVSIPKTDGKVEITLLMELHEWFVRLTVPLMALLVYHGARARREIRFPETEVLEPLQTVEEYEAVKAAEKAAREGERSENQEEMKGDNAHEARV